MREPDTARSEVRPKAVYLMYAGAGMYLISGIAGVATVLALASGPHGAWRLVGAIVGWFVGLRAIILLWQRSSSAYFSGGRI